MARIFIDGFEGLDFSSWNRKPFNGYVTASQKYSQGYSACMAACGDYGEITLPTPLSTIYFQLRIRPAGAPLSYNQHIISFLDSSHTYIAGIRQTITTLKIDAVRGTGTNLATGGTTLSANVWYLIEGKLVVDGSSGIFQIKLDSVASPLEIDFSGNTQGGSGSIYYVRLGDGVNSTGGVNAWYVDDFVLDDAAMPGNTRVMGIGVAGRSMDEGWTPSTGFNFECMNETPASDADYVNASAVDKVDLYPVLPVPQIPGTVKCVQVAARSWVTGSPTANKVKASVKTYATEYDGAAQALIQDNQPARYLTEVNPNTGVAWTANELRDLFIGLKSSS